MVRRTLPLLLAATLAGCVSDRIDWGDATAIVSDTIPGPGDDSLLTGSSLRKGTGGPIDARMCPGSVAYGRDPRAEEPVWPVFAAWLQLRPDSTVAVVASRYGGPTTPQTWDPPTVVDSLDVGKLGCNRPGPSIAVTELNVHVSYSIEAPEGYGVFFAHSMDNGVSFHSPMIIGYGDRLSRTATAAEKRNVVVAYEDPSGGIRRIDVAFSATDGHTFEPRQPASPDEMAATRPRIAIRDTVVTLSFAGADSTQRAIRIGYLRK